MYQKYIGFTFTILAICLFIPGIMLPMFHLSMDMSIGLSGKSIASNLVDKELSILTTISQLWQDNRYVVSILIFVFSIAIPMAKTAALSVVFFSKQQQQRIKISHFVTRIGKWSMADVFVVAVFLAVLSTNHTENTEQHTLSFFGLSVDFAISTQTLSIVGHGFYYFAGYCLLSMLGSQLMLAALSKTDEVD